MEIHDKAIVDLSPYLTKVEKRLVNKGKIPDRPAGQGADEVRVSDKARDIARIREVLGEAPEMRLDKLADIKRRIDDGSYSIDPNKVADSMIKDALMNLIPARDGD
ncbi:MAG TPA: flagellar biosynthesis anti-sigma factor FlgM [Nitrospirota bacterium]|jgi:flagellar biosynthesis anti-sigma factor FlgM